MVAFYFVTIVKGRFVLLMCCKVGHWLVWRVVNLKKAFGHAERQIG
jgi:hypothetical protein